MNEAYASKKSTAISIRSGSSWSVCRCRAAISNQLPHVTQCIRWSKSGILLDPAWRYCSRCSIPCPLLALLDLVVWYNDLRYHLTFGLVGRVATVTVEIADL